MNSNLSAEEEEEKHFFFSRTLYRSRCPAGLRIMYAHPQSCSETKGHRHRQKKKQMDRDRVSGKSQTRERQVRIQFTHIAPPKLVSVRGKFSLLLRYFLPSLHFPLPNLYHSHIETNSSYQVQ